MSNDLDIHVAALILDAVRENGESYSAFVEDIQPLLEKKYGIRFSMEVINLALVHLAEVDGVQRMPSSFAGDLLQISVESALQYYGDRAQRPGSNTTLEYDRFYEVAHSAKLPLKAYAYGGKTWVDRVLRSLASQDLPGVTYLGEELKSVSVPASDRIVTLSHNQQSDLIDATEEVVSHLKQENSIDGDSDQRERFLAQLAAGQELVRASSVRAYLVYETLARMLGTLIQKYQGHALGVAASKLLELLIEHIFGK